MRDKMKLGKLVPLSASTKIVLATLALISAALVLVATARYGVGLSPDSVGYISAARNMATQGKAALYDGSPLIVWPPLYPATLAAVYRALGLDPLPSARILNALIMGLLVYLSGILVSRYTVPTCGLPFLMALLVMFARPLLQVSVMAWSEPLFILFTLCFFISLNSYLAGKGRIYLILLTLSTALACLTRYVGVALIASGMLVILLSHGDPLRRRIAHSAFFCLGSIVPIAIWCARNYALSGTLFGPRAPSSYTLSQNAGFTLDTFLSWYLYRIFVSSRTVLMVLSASIGYLIGRASKSNLLTSLRLSTLPQFAILILFIVVYTLFMVVSSTTTAYDQIGNRLLSPIYIPATLLGLILARKIVGLSGIRLSRTQGHLAIVILVAYLLYPLGFAGGVVDRLRYGAGGYNTKWFRESEVIQYLQRNPLQENTEIYSNVPEALYILTNIKARLSPRKAFYNPIKPSGQSIDGLMGNWPQGEGFLVWLDQIDRPDLFAVEDLRDVAELSPIARLADGTIYSVSRREK